MTRGLRSEGRKAMVRVYMGFWSGSVFLLGRSNIGRSRFLTFVLVEDVVNLFFEIFLKLL